MLQEDHGYPSLTGLDARHLVAATGWLDLGDHDSAFEETCEISDEKINHPDVLFVRFKAYAAGGKFDHCEVVARALMKITLKWRNSVILMCSAIHWLGDSEQAYQLLKVHEDCGAWNWECHYDLACYSATTGREAEARSRLGAAFESAPKPDQVKEHALSDPDLESLWISRLGVQD